MKATKIKTDQAVKCEHRYLASQGVDTSFLDNLQEYTLPCPSIVDVTLMYGLNDISLWNFDDWMDVKLGGVLRAIRDYHEFTDCDPMFDITVLTDQEKSVNLKNVRLETCLDWCIDMLHRYALDSCGIRCRFEHLLALYVMTILGQILPYLATETPAFTACLRTDAKHLIHPLCTYRWPALIDSGVYLGVKRPFSNDTMAMCNDGIALDPLSRRQKKFVEWYGIHPNVLSNPAFYIAAKAIEGMHSELAYGLCDWDWTMKDTPSMRELCDKSEEKLLAYLKTGDATALAEGMAYFGEAFPGLWN